MTRNSVFVLSVIGVLLALGLLWPGSARAGEWPVSSATPWVPASDSCGTVQNQGRFGASYAYVVADLMACVARAWHVGSIEATADSSEFSCQQVALTDACAGVAPVWSSPTQTFQACDLMKAVADTDEPDAPRFGCEGDVAGLLDLVLDRGAVAWAPPTAGDSGLSCSLEEPLDGLCDSAESCELLWDKQGLDAGACCPGGVGCGHTCPSAYSTEMSDYQSEAGVFFLDRLTVFPSAEAAACVPPPAPDRNAWWLARGAKFLPSWSAIHASLDEGLPVAVEIGVSDPYTLIASYRTGQYCLNPRDKLSGSDSGGLHRLWFLVTAYTGYTPADPAATVYLLRSSFGGGGPNWGCQGYLAVRHQALFGVDQGVVTRDALGNLRAFSLHPDGLPFPVDPDGDGVLTNGNDGGTRQQCGDYTCVGGEEPLSTLTGWQGIAVPVVPGKQACDDNCPCTPNEDQNDSDRDGTGDECDPDDDNDTWLDENDNCPFDANPSQANSNEPEEGEAKIGNACEKDGDGDGWKIHQGNELDDDCRDDLPFVHPFAPELCNHLDDDCDGLIDEGFLDLNGDGYADCYLPIAPVSQSVDRDRDGDPDPNDCAPGDPDVGHVKPGNPLPGTPAEPGATVGYVARQEACNGRDDDCNGQVDEGCPDMDRDGSPDALDSDADGDGFHRFDGFHPTGEVYLALPSETYGADAWGGPLLDETGQPVLDTNGAPKRVPLRDTDRDPMLFPGAPELCDRLDNDLDGIVDEGFEDVLQEGIPVYNDGLPRKVCYGEHDGDADGVPDAWDCAPGVAAAHSGHAEQCGDLVDNNCDGTTDEACPDSDGDGLPDAVDMDADADGYPASIDCRDLDPAVHPGAADGCNLVDDDCDGYTDGYSAAAGGAQPCPNTDYAKEVEKNLPPVPDVWDLDDDGDELPDDGDGNPDKSTSCHPGQLTLCDDNCPIVYNPEQADLDADGIGDLCDADADGDGVLDEGESGCTGPACPAPDNCKRVANPDQLNTDRRLAELGWKLSDGTPLQDDGLGDACDGDLDGDGVANETDRCPSRPDDVQADTDGDGQGDACDRDDDDDGVVDEWDNCRLSANVSQPDQDADGIGDLCDDDRDGDGIPEALSGNGSSDPPACGPARLYQCRDNCPTRYNPLQEDRDYRDERGALVHGNGVGDLCDDDYDSDGIANDMDGCDEFALTASAGGLVDWDGDGLGDACDSDDDDDGWLEADLTNAVVRGAEDNCPQRPNPDQADTVVRGGAGDACDTDWDADGLRNEDDSCPYHEPDPEQGEPSGFHVDTDGDGMGNACDPDDDSDELEDAFEALLGTDARVRDTDGDGTSDHDELFREAESYDPLDEHDSPEGAAIDAADLAGGTSETCTYGTRFRGFGPAGLAAALVLLLLCTRGLRFFRRRVSWPSLVLWLALATMPTPARALPLSPHLDLPNAGPFLFVQSRDAGTSFFLMGWDQRRYPLSHKGEDVLTRQDDVWFSVAVPLGPRSMEVKAKNGRAVRPVVHLLARAAWAAAREAEPLYARLFSDGGVQDALVGLRVQVPLDHLFADDTKNDAGKKDTTTAEEPAIAGTALLLSYLTLPLGDPDRITGYGRTGGGAVLGGDLRLRLGQEMALAVAANAGLEYHPATGFTADQSTLLVRGLLGVAWRSVRWRGRDAAGANHDNASSLWFGLEGATAMERRSDDVRPPTVGLYGTILLDGEVFFARLHVGSDVDTEADPTKQPGYSPMAARFRMGLTFGSRFRF